MTFFGAYLVLIHALAFLGLSLTTAIWLHVWRNWNTPVSEPDETILGAETTVYAPPSYGLRVVK